MAEFEITACHADRAGHASVSLKDLATGALVMIHQMPFDHDYDETVGVECGRIQHSAAEVCQRVIAFLSASPGAAEVHPDSAPAAAPHPTEPANAFDQQHKAS